MLEWTDLQNQTAPGTGSLADADDINKIAHEVINNGTAIVTLNAQVAEIDERTIVDDYVDPANMRPVTAHAINDFVWDLIDTNNVAINRKFDNVDTQISSVEDLIADVNDSVDQLDSQNLHDEYVESEVVDGKRTATVNITADKNKSIHLRSSSSAPLEKIVINYEIIATSQCNELSFRAYDVAPLVEYGPIIAGDAITWLGAECSTVNGVSQFIPIPNKFYDIMITYVNGGPLAVVIGYEKATSNGVSENE